MASESGATPESLEQSRWQRLKRWLRRFWPRAPRDRSHRLGRLRDALASSGPVIEAFAERNESASWSRTATGLLERANCEARAEQPNRGWGCLLEAERQLIPGMTLEELRARACAVQLQAGARLRGWRRAAVADLLRGAKDVVPPKASDENVQAKVDALRVNLLEATRILNDHFHNEYARIDLRASNLARACGITMAVVVLVGVAAIVRLAGIKVGPLQGALLPFSFTTAWHLLLVILFGALGGSISSALPLAGGGGGSIPEQFSARLLVFARPFLGAAGALAVYVLLKAGVLQIAVVDPSPVAAWAFIAGFSERLLLRLVDTALVSADGGREQSGGDTHREEAPAEQARGR